MGNVGKLTFEMYATRHICTSCWWFRITILYIERRPSQFGELSAVVTKCVTDTSRWFSESLWTFWEDREEILMSPLILTVWVFVQWHCDSINNLK